MKLGKIIGIGLAGITVGVVSTVVTGIIFNKGRLTQEDILSDELEKAKDEIEGLNRKLNEAIAEECSHKDLGDELEIAKTEIKRLENVLKNSQACETELVNTSSLLKESKESILELLEHMTEFIYFRRTLQDLIDNNKSISIEDINLILSLEEKILSEDTSPEDKKKFNKERERFFKDKK